MYCPNCTTEISTGHRYCRSCGVDLREISRALGGAKQIDGSATVEETRPEQTVSPRTRVWRRGFYFGILGLMLAWLPWLGMVLMFCAVCLMLSSYFFRDQAPETRQSPTSTKELPPYLPAASVTERTTKLFGGQESEGSRTGSRSGLEPDGPM